MKNENKILLDKIISRKAKAFGLEMIKPERAGNVVSIMREDWHLFMEMRSLVAPPLQLQMAVYAKGAEVRMLIFPSPVIIKRENIGSFIYLSNVANHHLYRGAALGRFWVDRERLDFAYEVILKEDLLERCADEVENQLFDVPYAHFQDLHIPLVMLAGNVWEADTAIRYLEELRENGYVDNEKYGLW